ncbi:Cgd2_2430-like protein, partial [Chytridium lagenaria]
SNPITDRKSVFQGFCATINNLEELDEVRRTLRLNGKIARSTHLMWAYRISAHMIIRQDCDDDGEQAAGGRLLHLLQILELRNVVVLVARWYGGIQLGPARFKHINQAARDVL